MPRKRNKRQYFTQDTEDAIVEFNNSTDPVAKNRIYRDRIHYGFFKLTENIIHTFKFYHTEVDDLTHLQHEIICFLLEKMHLFNPERGEKAFSYFGTIVKRYLIIQNTKNYKKKIEKVPVSNLETNEDFSYNLDDKEVKSQLNNYIGLFTDHMDKYLEHYFPKENDAKTADAILELLKKRESLEVFNKKALYIYIREMYDVKTPKITKIAKQIYVVFKKHYLFYLENGWADFQDFH